MAKSLIEIEGFPELLNKIKKLDDKVKRTEVLKILRRVAEPVLKAAKSEAPVSSKTHYRYTGVKKGVRRKKGSVPSNEKVAINPTNLKKSLGKIVARRAKPNAVLDVGARSKGRKNDGYYAHMVVPKGFKGKTRKTGINNFLARAYSKTKGQSIDLAEKEIKKFIDKEVVKLSK